MSRILKAHISYLRLDTSFIRKEFWYHDVCPSQCWNTTSNLVRSASSHIPSIRLSTNSRSFCIRLPQLPRVSRSIRTLSDGVSYTLCALWHTSSQLLEPSSGPELRASLLTWNVPKRKFVLNFTTLMELILLLMHFSDQVKNRYRIGGQKAAQKSL
jgi:hypothetical protein